MTNTTTPASAALAPRAGARAWGALAVLMLPVLLVSIDITALNFALPEIAQALRPSASQQLWIIDAYSLVLVPGVIAMIVAGLLVVRIVRAVDPGVVVVVALGSSLAAYGMLAVLGEQVSVAGIAVSFALLGVGIPFAGKPRQEQFVAEMGRLTSRVAGIQPFST